jgi:hypothetical protein
VTVLLLEMTFPAESSILTTGWVASEELELAVLEGCVVNTSFDAGPSTVSDKLAFVEPPELVAVII